MPVTNEEWAALREDVGYIKAHVETVVEGLHSHDDRIRELEKRQWVLPGLSGLLGVLAGIFGHH